MKKRTINLFGSLRDADVYCQFRVATRLNAQITQKLDTALFILVTPKNMLHICILFTWLAHHRK